MLLRLVHSHDYEITGADVWAAYAATTAVAQTRGLVTEVHERIRRVVAAEVPGGLVSRVLGSELDREALTRVRRTLRMPSR